MFSVFRDLKLRTQLTTDQELDHARGDVDQLVASSGQNHGAMSQLSQDHLDWC